MRPGTAMQLTVKNSPSSRAMCSLSWWRSNSPAKLGFVLFIDCSSLFGEYLQVGQSGGKQQKRKKVLFTFLMIPLFQNPRSREENTLLHHNHEQRLCLRKKYCRSCVDYQETKINNTDFANKLRSLKWERRWMELNETSQTVAVGKALSQIGPSDVPQFVRVETLTNHVHVAQFRHRWRRNAYVRISTSCRIRGPLGTFSTRYTFGASKRKR